MSHLCILALTIWLAASGFWLSDTALALDQDALVPCYDSDRELVLRVVPWNCEGEVVPPSKAERLRERIRQQRLERAHRSQPRPRRPNAEQSGSGVVVTDAGHVVTAAHVVAGCQRIRLHHPSEPTRDARVVARHSSADLALLHATSIDRTPIAIPVDTNAAPGTGVATIGYPNMGRTAIRPIRKPARFAGLKAIGQKLVPGRPKIVFQGDLRPGHSGGALIDQGERLVGVVIAQIDTPSVYAATGRVIQHVGVAEPVTAVRELMASAEAPYKAPQPGVSGRRAERFVFRVTCGPRDDRK